MKQKRNYKRQFFFSHKVTNSIFELDMRYESHAFYNFEIWFYKKFKIAEKIFDSSAQLASKTENTMITPYGLKLGLNMRAPNLAHGKVIIVYKNSRYAHGVELAKNEPQAAINDLNNPLTKTLKLAHENNLKSIEAVTKSVERLKLDYEIKCRSDITYADLLDRLVICVGGDGTLLDVSHHCGNSPILGVNSDPKSSIGALCIATAANLDDILDKIYHHNLKPYPVNRLEIAVNQKILPYLALNDVLFCSKNPACMSRLSITFNDRTEIHHCSGIWIASAAGSTGAIFSAGAPYLAIEEKKALFFIREPNWWDQNNAMLTKGSFSAGEKLKLISRMDDGYVFIDGPHKGFELKFGESLEIGIASQPLWLFEQEQLNANRKKIVEQRLKMRGVSC